LISATGPGATIEGSFLARGSPGDMQQSKERAPCKSGSEL
jgi:hypothetical protein